MFLLRMILFLLIVSLVCVLVAEPLIRAFQGNVVINSLILGVLFLGTIFCITRVVSLWPAVRWVNAFRRGDAGLDVPRRTSLLAPVAAMLRDRDGPVSISPTANRIILDSVGARLDESRETTRYLTNLLIFLGILGTFWGLLQSTGAIQGALESVSVGAASAEAAFEELQVGLAGPLAGMDTAFSSSLFGIAGSLILGFLGLQAMQAQNRFYNDFEEWLSTITHIPTQDGGFVAPPPMPGVGAGVSPDLQAALNASVQQVEALRHTIERAEEQRTQTEQWLIQTTQNLSDMGEVVRAQKDLLAGIAQNGFSGQTVMSAEGGTFNLGSLEARLDQLASLTQQSDDRTNKTLTSLREITARLLQYAERGTAEQTVAALAQLNDTTNRLLTATQSGAAQPMQAMAASEQPQVPQIDPAVFQELNDKIGRLVDQSERAAEERTDQANLATLRSLDKTATKLLQSSEELGQSLNGGQLLHDIGLLVQELVSHARNSTERDTLETLRSINQMTHDLKDSAGTTREELVKELRSEMKVLAKTLVAVMIESRRNGDTIKPGKG